MLVLIEVKIIFDDIWCADRPNAYLHPYEKIFLFATWQVTLTFINQ